MGYVSEISGSIGIDASPVSELVKGFCKIWIGAGNYRIFSAISGQGRTFSV